MTIPFSEITEKHHLVCGAFLFYKLDNGLYKRYLITGCSNQNEILTIEEVEG